MGVTGRRVDKVYGVMEGTGVWRFGVWFFCLCGMSKFGLCGGYLHPLSDPKPSTLATHTNPPKRKTKNPTIVTQGVQGGGIMGHGQRYSGLGQGPRFREGVLQARASGFQCLGTGINKV